MFPMAAGVFSAFGLLVSPLSFDNLRSYRIPLSEITPGRLCEIFEPLIREATAFLRNAGLRESQIQITRKLDMRYLGQGFEIEVQLPHKEAEELLPEIPEWFAKNYKELYAFSLMREPLEIVNWKVEATGPLPTAAKLGEFVAKAGSGDPRKGSRHAYFPDCGSFLQCPVYDRYALRAGTLLTGPALLEERESTCVIGVGESVQVDENLDLRSDLSKE
jgi:N-methylhydantoinase A